MSSDSVIPSHPGDAPKWAALFAQFRHKTILVIGDMMLDRFIWGTVRRISPEAPVPVVEVERETSQPGGASNVVNNVVALGGQAGIVGVVGDDEHGTVLTWELDYAGVDVSGVVIDEGGRTTVKTRVVAHSQQVVRVDRERNSELTPLTSSLIRERVRIEAEAADAVVLSDYSKGVITAELADMVRDATRQRDIPVVANLKPRSLGWLRDLTVIQVNRMEAEQATGIGIRGDGDLEAAGFRLLELTAAKYVLITLGGQGLALFGEEGGPLIIPATPVQVYDVAGAGDTVASAFTLALSSDADSTTALELANLAAGAVVRKVGVATATPEEILMLHRELQAMRAQTNG